MADETRPNPLLDAKDLNPRITDVHLAIKNSDAILQLQKKFDSFNIAVKKPDNIPGVENDYFKRYNLAQRAQPDHGGDHIIDVQPDFRFPISYIIYGVIKAFPELDIKAHPSVSIYSLVAYQIIMLTAHLLMQDSITRPHKSWHAQSYFNDVEKKDYYRLLQRAYVPQSLSVLLEQFATTYDPARPNCVFVPTLAGCKFTHDFGRMLPPQIFLTMHNLLANQRANVPVIEMKRLLYREPIVQYGEDIYTVSHFIGGYYNHNNIDCFHANWINRIIEDFFSPSCGRSHIARPNLTEILFNVEIYEEDAMNPYDVMLCYSDLYFGPISQFINRVSSFLEQSDSVDAIPLGAIAQKIGGITIMTHTIESLELPTWHKLKSVSSTEYTASTKMTKHCLSEYCKVIKYKQPAPTFKGEYKTNEKDNRIMTHLVTALKFDNKKPIYSFRRSTEAQRKTDVFIFQPYIRQMSVATTATTLGLKIVSEEFDAAHIPLPNPANSLNFNNSAYSNGSIPITYVKPILADNVQDIQPIARVTHREHPNGFAIRDASNVIVPLFAMTELNLNDQNNLDLRGLTFETNHNNPDYAYTHTAWGDTGVPTIKQASLYLWSSYRHVISGNTQISEPEFYYSMRPMYGLGVPLSRIPHPTLMLP